MKAMIMILAVICIGWTTVGCVSSRDESVYSRDAAMRAQEVEMATVEHLAIVKLEGTRSGAGGAVGGIAGGVLGAQVGSGSGSTIGAVVGALAGLAVGALTEEQITGGKALELTVKLDSGKTIVVVQQTKEQFTVGERVRVIKSPDGKLRVRP